MNNQDIAKILFEIADILELQDVQFKPQAYRKAARTIESMEQSINEVMDLESIPGVGKGIAKKIKELLETGKLNYFEELKKQTPIDFEGLMAIEGMGPKKMKFLYKKLKIKNVDDLKKAALNGKIVKLDPFKEKTQQNILDAIELSKKHSGRFSRNEVQKDAKEIKKYLKKLKEVEKIEIAGSYRRNKETIGDLDILIASNESGKVMDYFVKFKKIKKIFAKGPTKTSVVLKSGLQVDLRVVKPESYGSALLYFTGSKDHNVKLRIIALKKGYRLNEYGLYDKKTKKLIASKTEKEIYKKLGLKYLKPELRL